MTADLSALIARLEAASGPDRALDREIGLLIGGWDATVDSLGECLMVNGDRYPDHPGSEYPSLTESLDAALALAERVLPGWPCWGVATDAPGRIGAVLARSDRDNGVMGYAPTPALALCIAVLRAKLDGYEAEGGVNQIKAKAQGEGQ